MMILKNNFIKVSLFLAVLLLMASSCATVGRKFPVDPVSQIQIGETTQQDINAIFGTPWRTGLEDGRKTWTYGYYKYRLFGTTTTRDLVIRFDADGRVYSYTFNTSDVGE